MEEMTMAMYQEKDMIPIPKKYEKTAVAAYNTVPEAEAFAEELTQETGFAYSVTVDNQSGAAVVQMEKTNEGTALATEYGYIPFDEYGLKGIKEVSLFGNGDLLELFVFCPKHNNGKHNELKELLKKARKKYDCWCYAVVFVNQCGNGEFLVSIRRSALRTADGQEFTEGMTVYAVGSNTSYTVEGIECKEFEPNHRTTSERYEDLDCFVLAPYVTVSDESGEVSSFCFDFQFGSGFAVWDINCCGFCGKEYEEPVLFKTTLWNARESTQAYRAEKCQRKQAANKVFKLLNKGQLIFTRTVTALLLAGVLAITNAAVYWKRQCEVVDTKDITVTACSSLRQYTDVYGTTFPTYKLTEEDGTEAYFIFKDSQELMDIPADNTVTVTINTRRDGKKTVSYNGEKMYRIEFTD